MLQTGQAAAMRQLRTAVAARMDAVRHAIAQSFPAGTRVSDPPGGLLLWLELPRGLDTLQLHAACLQEHILIPPGTVFGTGGRFLNCVRVGVGGDWTDAHVAALRRAGAIACAMAARRPVFAA